MLSEDKRKYLFALSEKYPSDESVSAEVLRLTTELYLPKGTEHFLSDLHGEYEAYSHVRRSASGVIRRKIDKLFPDESEEEKASLAALIYYPEYKVDLVKNQISTIRKMIVLLSLVCEKYTDEKARGSVISEKYGEIIYSLLRHYQKKSIRFDALLERAIRLGEGKNLIISLSAAIRKLSVDRVHIVGDIFDRGPRPDKILDELCEEEKIDIQWGNHDILWMGAASGSEVCIMGALFNSLTYRNLDFIEVGYGISLRPLAEFAKETYFSDNLEIYLPKGDEEGIAILHDNEKLIAAMRKAVAVITWKLEGILILQNPDFDMTDRLLLDKISDGKISLYGKEYLLRDERFPTLDHSAPYELTKDEKEVTNYLKNAFLSSDKLQRHVSFLYKVGSMYKIYNRNLIFHGSIPMDENGEFLPLGAAMNKSGRALMDYCDLAARDAFFKRDQKSLGFMWFLWCGKNSPLTGRERITTFERLLINETETHFEQKNSYYKAWESPALCEKILSEFGVGGVGSHIINGHIPVKKGENPIKADGKLVLIDGGFCHAFLGRTGIAGYTLIYNSEGMRISAHVPFAGREAAIKGNADIIYNTSVFEIRKKELRTIDTDIGKEIIDKIADLMMLREAYRSGELSIK